MQEDKCVEIPPAVSMNDIAPPLLDCVAQPYPEVSDVVLEPAGPVSNSEWQKAMDEELLDEESPSISTRQGYGSLDAGRAFRAKCCRDIEAAAAYKRQHTVVTKKGIVIIACPYKNCLTT